MTQLMLRVFQICKGVRQMKFAATYIFVMLFLFAALTACTSSSTDEPAASLPPSAEPAALGIYLVKQENQADLTFPIDFDSVELQERPIIGIDDIRMYNQETHTIELEPYHLMEIGWRTGDPFVLCVGKDRIYGGSFYHPLSSSISPGIIIRLPLVPKENPYVTIEALLLDDQDDPRSDPRIMGVLQTAGKLN